MVRSPLGRASFEALMLSTSHSGFAPHLAAERRGWSPSTAGAAPERHASQRNLPDGCHLHPWSTPTTSPVHASQVGIGSALLARFSNHCSVVARLSFNAMTGMPIIWLSGTPFLRVER